jgi:NAD(P)-dependent dehydrogenase (short-subunit alcohol dehydrogenase family)
MTTGEGTESQRLAGEVAIVSGGAGGIGRATAHRLAAEGARVTVADLDRAGGETAAAQIGASARFSELDVTDPDRWASCVSEAESTHGPLTILVNAAGVLHVGTVAETTIEEWRRIMAINLDGVFYGCRAGVRAMRANGRGAIVNVASISGIRVDPRTPAYDASKAGVSALTKEVAVHCARSGYGVRCNSVHPGSVRTTMMDRLAELDSELHRQWVEAAPMGRLAEPGEVAAMIAYLASEEAGFVTGAEFVVDGGASV